MNTSKLHVIASALKDELARCGTVAELQKAITALQQLIKQPNQPNLQQQLSAALTQLYTKLEDSPVDEYSPAWRDAMEELGVDQEFGKQLEENIKTIIEKNQMTHQVAFDELSKIHNEIKQTEGNLNGLVTSLVYFSVGEDELGEDECEIGVIVPRKYVDNNAKKFGQELIELEKILIVFTELSTGERDNLKIRTISSSELSVFFDFLPVVGASIAVAVERIVALYKNMLEIKKLKAELVKQNVPDDKLTGIEEHAESIATPEIENLTVALITEFGGHLNDNRKNEIKIELRHSLKKLANRVDRGFNIELRVSHIDKTDEDDSEEQNGNANSQANLRILEASKNIEYSKSSGEPVLFFPENEADE